MTTQIFHGDCVEVMKTLPDCSVDAVVTDPPYGLTQGKKGGSGEASVNLNTPHGRARITSGFMGMKWDADVPPVEVWAECLRVLKPGGYLLAFAATRTQHRMCTRIEDAGFEIRDMIAWVYGSGFPKSRNGEWGGTALKPALEPITVARKPRGMHVWKGGLAERFEVGHVHSVIQGSVTERAGVCRCGAKLAWRDLTVAENWREHGTGALNIDVCRVGTDENLNGGGYSTSSTQRHDGDESWRLQNGGAGEFVQPIGRWPANLIHDGSAEVLAAFPDAPGQQASTSTSTRKSQNVYGTMAKGSGRSAARIDVDSGAARFFYCAKADRADRNEGLTDPGPQFKQNSTMRDAEKVGAAHKGNFHPTVKPTDLMRYLCRLVTPAGGVVLDPFMGSGSTLKAAELEGFSAIGIELDADYIAIARRRIGADAPLFAEVL